MSPLSVLRFRYPGRAELGGRHRRARRGISCSGRAAQIAAGRLVHRFMNSHRVLGVMDSPVLSWVRCGHRDVASAGTVDPNRDGRWLLRRPSTESSSVWRAVAPPRMRRSCERGFCSWPAVRAQVAAFACTLPRDFGKPLSRWSVPELARAVIHRGIVRRISAGTIWRWLQADRIKPWQYPSWQRPTDPRFLDRAVPILTLTSAPSRWPGRAT
jgi:hypothetical protein